MQRGAKGNGCHCQQNLIGYLSANLPALELLSLTLTLAITLNLTLTLTLTPNLAVDSGAGEYNSGAGELTDKNPQLFWILIESSLLYRHIANRVYTRYLSCSWGVDVINLWLYKQKIGTLCTHTIFSLSIRFSVFELQVRNVKNRQTDGRTNKTCDAAGIY